MNQLTSAGFGTHARKQLLIRHRHHSATQLQARGYSFFSSKGGNGGGKYFTGNANGKAAGAGAVNVNNNNGRAGTGSGTERVGEPKGVVSKGPGSTPGAASVTKPVVESSNTAESAAAAASSSTTNANAQTTNDPSSLNHHLTQNQNQNQNQSQSQPPPPLSHPQLTARDLQMHRFFSLHRPLLTLTSPSVFHTPTPGLFPFLAESSPSGSGTQVQAQSSTANANAYEESEASSEEADATDATDAQSDSTALLLWRSLIASQLTPSISFHSALAHLGSSSSKEINASVERSVLRIRSSRTSHMERVGRVEAKLQGRFGRGRMGVGAGVGRREYGIIWADSTKRKRRKKMSKHKLKKRRRLERSLRRQQSK